MSVIIDQNVDVTDRVIRIGENKASQGSVEGILAPSKTFKMADNDGFFNFLTPIGLFFRNAWRGLEVDDSGKDGQEISRTLIEELTLEKSNLGFTTDIKGRSPISHLLDWPVESNDADVTFEVNGAHSKGITNNTVNVKTGTVIIPVLSQVSFTDSLVPRYQVIAQTDDGSKTTSITLDRGLERDLADNDTIRFTTPVLKTGPEELYDSLLAIQGEVSVELKIGSSFQVLHAADSSAGYSAWVHVRREDNVSFGRHIAQILEMFDLGLSINDAGVIDIYRGNDYKGEAIIDRITGAEIVVPFSFKEDSSRLVIGYDCLYMESTDQVVRVASGDVAQELITEYRGVKRWVPVPANNNSADPFQYTVLYGNSTTADYFGQRRLDYYGYPRILFRGPVKRSYSDKPLERITPQLGKQYLLTCRTAKNERIVDEPVRVRGFQYEDSKLLYTSMTLEFSNRPTPNLIVDRVDLPVPPFVSISGAFTAYFDPLEYDLRAEIYLEDQVFRLLENIALVPGFEDPYDKVMYANSDVMQNGQTYYVRFYYTKNGVDGPKTDFIAIVPDYGDQWITEASDEVVTDAFDEVTL